MKTRRREEISIYVKLVLSALLVAFFIVNNRFIAIRPMPFATLSLAILAVIVAAFIMGPRWAMLVAGAAEALAAIMFPVGGAWWPEITVGWILAGLIFGFFLDRRYNKCNKVLLVNLILSSVFVYVIIHLFYMAGVFYFRLGAAFWTILLINRAWPFAVMMVIQIVIAFPLLAYLRRPIDKFLIADDEEEECSTVQ